MSGRVNKKKISEVAETALEAGEKLNKKTKSFWKDFKKFAVKGNVIDLAVAVVIGAAFNKIITSLVTYIITPLTGLLIHTGDLAGLKWVISPAVAADEAAGVAATPEVAVAYGLFLQSLIDFLVIALTIFIILRIFMKFKNSINSKEIEAAEAKARAEEAQKKAEAAAEAERQENIRKQFIADVAAQAELLKDIRDIMLRMETGNNKPKE
jgi:large conductance mechanosensitive channel